MATQPDIDLIESCLKYWRNHARKFQYGGLMQALKDTQQALEAIDRIRQPSLLDCLTVSVQPKIQISKPDRS